MTTVRRRPRLSDPRHATDHLSVVVNPRLYGQRTLLVVTADDDDHPVDHFEVVDCSEAASASECAAVLDNLAACSETATGAAPRGLVLALTRPGDEIVQPIDRVWFRAFHRVCHSRGFRPLGVYTVGMHGVRPIQIDDAC